MKVCGKCRPVNEALRQRKKHGFDYVELYTTMEIFDERKVGEIVSVCEEGPVEIVSVHTPHVAVGQSGAKEYLQKTDHLATELDATLVLHSGHITVEGMTEIYPPEEIIAKKYGYENHPSTSSFYITRNHLENGYPLILDTAHLNMAEEDYLNFLKRLMRNYQKQIPVVHLADGSRKDDGWDFDSGNVPLEEIFNILRNYKYPGDVILEVPVDNQKNALNIVREF